MICNKNKDFGGVCCCNCQHQKPIYRHPGNMWVGVGRTTEIFGYICTVFDGYVFSEIEQQHSLCELHVLKKDE